MPALSAKNRHFLLNRKSNSKSVSKSPSRKDKTSQRPSNITLTASSGNASNWVASSSPSAQTTTYATPTTRSLPFYSSPTQVGAIPTSSPPLYSDPPLGYGSPSTFGTGTHLPSNLDLHGRFFNSPDLLSPSYSPRAPSLRTPPFNTVGSSSISPDPVLPSYTGSFAQPSSYSLSSQSSTYPFPTVSSNASSNEMYYSYLQSTSSAAPYSATANAYTTTSSTYPGAIAYTSPHTSYSWPTAHQDEINAGNFINDDEAEEDEDEEGGGDSSEGLEESDPEGVQRIWVEAECERGQVESLMQSVHAYSRSATFMPRPGQ
ncbi:MAG: hypothetical protein M1822_009520 [Bathelium mastoideum]|nr:MAG: hypothetical protein M1822_009520 [Bathelium mastoideum]